LSSGPDLEVLLKRSPVGCSIEPEENRAVVDAVLQAMPELELEAEEAQASGKPADGGYWARLRRKRS
jgi:16S rRNA (cytosine967-C5)-methyltransferase